MPACAEGSSRQSPGRQAQGGSAPPPPAYDSPRNYSNYGMPSPGPPPNMQGQQRGYGGGGGSGGGGGGYSQPTPRKIPLRLAKVDDKTLQQIYIFGNVCAVSPNDFPPQAQDYYLRLSGDMMRDDCVVTARPTPGFRRGLFLSLTVRLPSTRTGRLPGWPNTHVCSSANVASCGHDGHNLAVRAPLPTVFLGMTRR